MKRVTRECDCGREAKWEVFNHRNASQGIYCKACATQLVKETNARERKRGVT